MPRTRLRVVCTLRDTIDTLLPTSALMSVDLPTLGAPMSATKPQRVALSPTSATGTRACPGPDAFAPQQPFGGGLLGAPAGATGCIFRRQPFNRHDDAKLRRVVGSAARQDRVRRRRQAAALHPFLQRRFGI